MVEHVQGKTQQLAKPVTKNRTYAKSASLEPQAAVGNQTQPTQSKQMQQPRTTQKQPPSTQGQNQFTSANQRTDHGGCNAEASKHTARNYTV